MIFGIDTVLSNLNAMKTHSRMKMIYRQVQQAGSTFEAWHFARRVITTVNARNIQFVLSTENEKFSVGPVREIAQTAMTGRGIITSDGHIWMREQSLIRTIFTRT